MPFNKILLGEVFFFFPSPIFLLTATKNIIYRQLKASQEEDREWWVLPVRKQEISALTTWVDAPHPAHCLTAMGLCHLGPTAPGSSTRLNLSLASFIFSNHLFSATATGAAVHKTSKQITHGPCILGVHDLTGRGTFNDYLTDNWIIMIVLGAKEERTALNRES